MSQETHQVAEENLGAQAATTEARTERKSYAPPRILHREPLEAMAATCVTPGLGKAVVPCTLLKS